MKNIALLEDHTMVREGLESLVTLNDDYVLIGSFDNAEDLLKSSHLSSIDLLISDIRLGGLDGLSLAETLKNSHPDMKIIILSMHESAFYVSRAQSIGVEGYISKREASSNLLGAIESVLRGKICYETILSVENDEKEYLQLYLKLTDREKQIFILLAQGNKIKQVSAKLEIAVKTVHAHKQNIFQKMKLYSDFDTTRVGLKLGLIELVNL